MSWMNNNGNNNFNTMQKWNLPHYEAPMLNGRNDANNFLIGPNSSVFLPDANADIIWWIKTDSLGNKNISAWDIKPHEEPAPVDLNALQARLASVEEWINAKQNKSNANANAKQRNNNNTNTNTNESNAIG